jgi:hypothetical protein
MGNGFEKDVGDCPGVRPTGHVHTACRPDYITGASIVVDGGMTLYPSFSDGG